MDLVHRRTPGPSSDQPCRTNPDDGPTLGWLSRRRGRREVAAAAARSRRGFAAQWRGSTTFPLGASRGAAAALQTLCSHHSAAAQAAPCLEPCHAHGLLKRHQPAQQASSAASRDRRPDSQQAPAAFARGRGHHSPIGMAVLPWRATDRRYIRPSTAKRRRLNAPWWRSLRLE
eukprot:scaffold8113_cov67-Phaeocystis_antarctica.AAC.3